MTEIPKAYDPGQVEPRWYKAWLDAGAFSASPIEYREAYCIVIPPPNVTGVLTIGHVLNITIQDILVRRARLLGKAAMWLPGTDHASIATHAKVEAQLRSEGTNRRELGREKFIERTWDWSHDHGGKILGQLRRLGASCDWDRTVFTMDDDYSRSVLTAFVKLYERGYIYRGKRMVNWCPVSLTALSDEEVIMKPQQGLLYKIRYELVDQPGQYLEISTTRPETLMGDTAVAVHPKDERYSRLVGKKIWRPFPKEKLPIIADEAVDREFGTGVLKVTPAHDKLDFEIGRRHDLPVLDILNPDGTLNALAGEDFDDMERFAAREFAVKKLDEMGLLVDQEPYENNVGYSQRADVPIEPRLSDQWWMRYPKVEEAKAVVRDGLVQFWPKRWEKTYQHWLENLQDWCISRQLWWGQRIPVWYKKNTDRTDPDNLHVSVDGPDDPENWEQEEDVLDTWASSWLWPFATMGWPEPNEKQKQDLDFFYPTSDLVTGPDIIFFWVARMIIAGLEFMGDEKETLTKREMAERIPFHNVYFTGIIRDDQGRKISKSLGNSPEPLDLMDKFGADGLRFGIMNIAPKGQDIRFSEDRITIGRNFCNKLWNACRFRQMSGPLADNSSLQAVTGRLDPKKFDEYDHWIIARLIQTVRDVDQAFSTYEFNQLTQILHSFFWGDFCDWYVEVSKTKLQSDTSRDNCLALQDLVIRQVLQMLYPIIPHITEELWRNLGYNSEGGFIHETPVDTPRALVKALRDTGLVIEASAVEHIEELMELVTQARSLKSNYNLASIRDVNFYITADPKNLTFINSQSETIKRLVGAAAIIPRDDALPEAPATVIALGTLYLDLARSIDVDAEKIRLSKELAKLEKAIATGASKLDNKKFLSQAPEQVVKGARDLLAATRSKKEEIERILDGLG